MGSLVVGIFAFLSQTICNKDWWGITIHGCVIMLYFVLLFKKYMTGKISNFCILLMGTSVVCSLAFDLIRQIFENWLYSDAMELCCFLQLAR